jgi:hypothetical protein
VGHGRFLDVLERLEATSSIHFGSFFCSEIIRMISSSRPLRLL